MHEIEPFYRWRDDYIASEDDRSPFYGMEYSEFEFDKQIYNFLLHPQWDTFGSTTLYLKVLYTDYEKGGAIIELIGEWNDAIYNDIMLFKRELIDVMVSEGIHKFVLIGENVLNFHASDDSYYEEWFQDIENGWIVGVNFQSHVIDEFKGNNIDYFINFGGIFNEFNWRNHRPDHVIQLIDQQILRRLT